MENLLEDVAKTGIDRVRFVTSHPWDFTDNMIDIIKKYDNICNYIHLPVQSGSSRILKLMGRRYTKESYLELYKKIREKLGDNASITTDIIVGFPGETNEDFEETLKLPQHIVDFWDKRMKNQVVISNIKDEHDYTMDYSERILKKKQHLIL